VSNVEILRTALSAPPGSPGGFYETLAGDVVWDMSRFPGIEQVYHGRDAVKRFMPSWRYGWEIWRFTDDDFVDAGDDVVTLVHGPLPAGSGADDGPAMACVWSFQEGKVVRFTWYQRFREALSAAGIGHPRPEAGRS
jgi:ketosteroid isomerase-like protein